MRGQHMPSRTRQTNMANRISLNQNISTIITEEDLIFTEHHLDTKEDET